MILHRVEEFQITKALHQKVQSLLELCFQDYPTSQDFLHQKPNFRYLMLDDKKLVGHMAVDHRIIQLDDQVLSIFGIIDLCVHPDYQHKKLASELITTLEVLALEHEVEALLLFSNLFSFYDKLGFEKKSNKCRWLMIQNNVSLGVARRALDDCLMVKMLTDNKWPSEKELDLLGHVF
jgi:N-acetylglutamate synthase-like GNAT family acetyltransferase